MNPILIEAGPLTLRAYTAWLSGALLVGLGVIAWGGWQRAPEAATRWLDVAIVALAAGIVGARALHVALEWDYFTDHRAETWRVWEGGLAWHGGLMLAVPVALVMMRLRRVSLGPWTDMLALAWPIGMIGAWSGCRAAGCGYGHEVRTLADWPGWAVAELPDVYGVVAPRLDTQLAGIAFGSGLLALALLLTWRGWLRGLRFWLILALSGIGLYVLGFFRADPAVWLLDRRADQVFDLAVLLLAVVAGGAVWLERRREASHRPLREDEQHEAYPGDRADQPEAGGRSGEPGAASGADGAGGGAVG
ncbi:MAG: prolipoprotein diacylglyceryl transferase [Chloroflexi bacterium]|nr:prolipoprotein diacylglyceryl transferase [Chloroflexota bacterium]